MVIISDIINPLLKMGFGKMAAAASTKG